MHWWKELYCEGPKLKSSSWIIKINQQLFMVLDKNRNGSQMTDGNYDCNKLNQSKSIF